ncbi:MAG TPA: RNA 2',3'-cyclic phosphodiesterase [Candidatus Limnocylindria bacterium]|nr:RNA 2',3'-cyclic phosphodiesterase [Candidatus Limnocylindria bacterium]
MRLFIAVPLPLDLCLRAAALLPAAQPGLTLVRPDLMHVTLAFLGWITDERLPDAVAASVATATGQRPFELSFDRPGRFPPSGRPRVAWLGAGSGASELAVLAAAVTGALRERGLRFDDRPFAPHLTLARVRERVAPDDARAIASAIDSLAVPLLRCRVDRIAVVESVLSSKGPRYAERASAGLG